jgi:transcription antitermination factor NusG
MLPTLQVRVGRMQPLVEHTLPILPAEPDFYPPELWQDPESVPRQNSESVWWCLHTKPRQEKATARELRKGGLTFYLPQVLKEDRTPQGRKIRSVIPLFSSYLFLLGDLQDRLAALRGNRLVTVLEVSDQKTIEHDLRQIHRMLSAGLPVQPEPTIPVGARVKITTGPLAGIEGTVIRRGKRDQFVAVVQFLGRGATVDLQDWQVEQVIVA